MQQRVVLVSAAVVLGLTATVLGFVATKKSKGIVSFESLDGEQHCVYRRNPGLGCGVAGALLALTAVFLATAARGVAAAGDGRDAPATGRMRAVADRRTQRAWAAVLMATVMFLYGAAMKRGLSRPGWYGRFYEYGCAELRRGFFSMASILSAVATGYAIGAYAASSFQRADGDDEPAPAGVAMGQPQPAPQWAQPDPPPSPASPHPQYGHGGYDGPRQPAGTA